MNTVVDPVVAVQAVHVAEAAGAATGGRGSYGRDGGAFSDWWDRGSDYLDDLREHMGRMGRGRDGYDMRGYVDRINRGFRDFGDHLRRVNRGWDGYEPGQHNALFDGWSNQWNAMRNRFTGTDWTRDWGTLSSPYRSIMNDFDGFYRGWNRMRDGWYR